MYVLKLCVRNVVRHFRRSAAAVLVVALGFVSLSLFGGYAVNVFNGLADQAIRGEGLAHLTIAKRGFFENGRINPAKYILPPAQLEQLLEITRSQEGVVLATPRLGVTGLISNGQMSTVFLADGAVVADAQRIRGDFRSDRKGVLSGRTANAVMVSNDLAGALGVKAQDTAALFTSTVEGSANALDAQVEGTYDTGNAATNDKALVMPYEFAQKLFDTEGAERVVVLLADTTQTAKVRAELNQKLKPLGVELEIRTWEELSVFYRQVRDFLSMIFMFIFSIVFVVVLMSVANTMSMTVMERTREIGTLRALGMKQMTLTRLFSGEGVMLGMFGCLIGLPITVATALAVNARDLRYVPPNSSDTVPLQVDLLPSGLVAVFLLLTLVAGAASFVPSARAARFKIVEALGHT